MKIELPQINILEEAVKLYGVQMLLRDAESAAEPAAKKAAQAATAQPVKNAYHFGAGEADGDATMRDLLGGKGANLAEMARTGVPVPPGFTLRTGWCRAVLAAPNKASRDSVAEAIRATVLTALDALEQRTGRKFGDAANPLFVSVRSGARDSMPGMMETILNVGTSRKTAQASPQAKAAYRRFVEMYARIVLGVKAGEVGLVKAEKRVPADPREALVECVLAVFRSWNTERAKVYRDAHGISHDLGTACTVQQMVFGLGPDSGTGVLFTRDPQTGEPGATGEYLPDAQGEDVVAGIRTPEPLAKLAETMPAVHAELMGVVVKLERHFGDMQDVEFTVEAGKLYVLQTRNGKRSARAMLHVAIDLANEGLIGKDEAVRRIDRSRLPLLTMPTIKEPRPTPLAKGIGASPGVATGIVVTSAAEAVVKAPLGMPCILVTDETDPDDLPGMMAAKALVTRTGGKTSHAAVVALGFGKPCVVGIGHEAALAQGVTVTVDGATGEVFAGALETVAPEADPYLATFEAWWKGSEAGQFAEALRSTLAEQVRRLDANFRYYLFLAVVGELRHAPGMAQTTSESGMAAIEQVKVLMLGAHGRQAVQDGVAKRVADRIGTRGAIDLCCRVFRFPWRGGYGGKAWVQIAETLRDRFRYIDTEGAEGLPAEVFVDRTFDLQHNNGRVFNKRNEVTFPSYKLASFLDAKRKARGAVELAKWYAQFPPTRALYAKAERLGLIAALDDKPAPAKPVPQPAAPAKPKLVCDCKKTIQSVKVPRKAA